MQHQAVEAKNLTYWQMTRDRMRLLSEKAGCKISDALASFKDISDKVCIASTGSDGRLEKGFVSRLELIY